ncbi:MAG: class I SAM-dependent methyltransferase [Bacillota bacterium]
MPLYHDFSDVYDIIFPEKEATTHFLKTHLKQSKVLDIACGTGTYAIKLAEHGYEVLGTDLNQSMIAKAKTKRTESFNPKFIVEDMLNLNAHETYDSIYSIGNSIVHLKNEATIALLFKKIYRALKPQGVFIMQIINYARILDQTINQLATIENASVIFERKYVNKAPHIAFNTALTMDDETTYNTVLLYPIRPKIVISLLKDIGFKEVTTYGGFNEVSFDEQSSIPFIVVAEKRV